MCISVLPACIYVHPVHAWDNESQKKTLDSLDLEFRMVVSHNKGAQN